MRKHRSKSTWESWTVHFSGYALFANIKITTNLVRYHSRAARGDRGRQRKVLNKALTLLSEGSPRFVCTLAEGYVLF